MRKQIQENPRMGGRSFFDDNSFRVKYTPSSAGKYDIFLYGDIEDANQFTDAIEALGDATEGDLVVVHLSTNGGSVGATDTFLHALRECQGRVVVKATGGVHSAGTIILLNADEFMLSENFSCLIHNGSMGAFEKTSDMKAYMAFSAAHMDRLARSIYEGFLTKDELEAMIAGKDFWMDAPEFMRRINQRAELLGEEVLDTEVDERDIRAFTALHTSAQQGLLPEKVVAFFFC